MNSSRLLSRRQTLQALAGITATGALASALPAFAASPTPLKDLAAEKGLLFGSAVGAGKPGTLTGSFENARYRELLKAECNVLVAENEHKIYVIANQPDRYDFEPADRLTNFALENGMKMRGHTLFWNRVDFLPQWVLNYDFGPFPAIEGERFLRDYIETVCNHYKGRIYSWDVVNETIDPQTGLVRDTPFTKAMGFDALRVAYEAAREYAPGTELVYNDYMGWEKGNETHRNGVLKLLEKFKKENVPIDAFGVQSHLGNDGRIDNIQHKEWKAFIDEIVGMGYNLLITELDVNDKDLPADIKTRDAQQAAVTKDYLDFMLSYPQLKAVLCWGLVDNYSWLQGFAPRADGKPQRPTPYDTDFKPKPIREAIAAAFKAAPAR